ncbi:MAG: UbiA family prenyltransferase [Candidatus Brockarchaeota archaeon]|nr:UbiA family prenyltransferase [Candidatus Brockarchaeota archaeon]
MVALEGLPSLPLAVFPFLASFFITASSFAFNDYFDFEIDRINRPDRPIPSGIVSRGSALVSSLIFALLGFSFALTTNIQAFAVFSIAFFLSVVYSIYGKAYGLLGNMMVAFCVSTPFVFGALSATASISYVVFSFFILSFFSNLGREIVQSIHDMEGDRLKKIRSVAIVHCPLVAAILGSACYAVTVFLGPLFFLKIFEKTEPFPLVTVIASEIGFLVSIFYLLKNPSKERALKTIRQVNLWMFLILIGSIMAASL